MNKILAMVCAGTDET